MNILAVTTMGVIQPIGSNICAIKDKNFLFVYVGDTVQ